MLNNNKMRNTEYGHFVSFDRCVHDCVRLPTIIFTLDTNYCLSLGFLPCRDRCVSWLLPVALCCACACRPTLTAIRDLRGCFCCCAVAAAAAAAASSTSSTSSRRLVEFFWLSFQIGSKGYILLICRHLVRRVHASHNSTERIIGWCDDWLQSSRCILLTGERPNTMWIFFYSYLCVYIDSLEEDHVCSFTRLISI